MISTHGRRSGGTDEATMLDLTALVDVIFILLVFFLLTANTPERALTLDLPEQGAEQARPITASEQITLTLFAETERWAVDDQPMQDWQAVERAISRLHAERPNAEIIIAGDRQVSLEKLLQALAFLQRHGTHATQILMDNAPSTEPSPHSP